jgi:membrane protease YdiL (CAAX protease family)
MSVYIETLILYAVLFLSGSVNSVNRAETAGFSAMAEVAGIFTYTIPALALIWYLLLKVKQLKDWDILPAKKDLFSGLITLPGLLVISFSITFVLSYLDITDAPNSLHSPSTAVEWIILGISCLTGAYLEESFFRFYILSRREELRLSSASALILSVALFSICHIYEGPWGFLNAVLSGILLAFIFLRYQSLHGVALAHSFYNVIVYATASLSAR